MIIEGWMLTIILMLVIPFGLASLGSMRNGGKLDISIFLCSISIMITYLIYIGTLPGYTLIFSVIIIGFMFFGGRGGTNE